MSKQSGHLGIGSRLREGPAPELVNSAFALEAADGPLLYRAMSLADLAHVVMLIEAGIVPPVSGAKLLTALVDMHAISPAEFPFDPAHGDAYTNREHFLHQKAPDVAGWIQAGRPRREVTTLAYLLVVRDRLLQFAEALLKLLDALLSKAESHLHTILPDYTYLQTAHPTTLAHYLLTFAVPVTRDLVRLQAVFERVNCCPAGAGSTNGSRLPLNRKRLAHLLGFAEVAVHTRDAMWQPDTPIELMSTVVAALVNADRLAEDLQIWATAEFNFIELADRHARVSVIMPQKKNPYSLAFVRGVARSLLGEPAAIAALGATPSGQVDNRVFIYGRVPASLERASRALELLAGVVAGLKVNTEVMAQRAEQGFAAATDLAEMIMLEHQLDPRTTHRIVALAVRRALEQNNPLAAALLDQAATEIIGRSLGMSDRAIADFLDPREVVATRTGPGGAAPPAVQAMLDSFGQAAASCAQWRDSQQTQLESAEGALMRRVEELCQRT